MKETTNTVIKVKKPKYQEHEDIADIAKRLKSDYRKRSVFSSYSDYEINTERLLEVSKGNEKLVDDVLEMISFHQNEEKSTSGFQDIQAFFIRKNDSLGETVEWIHVVFDHGYGVTLLAGRVGHADWTFKHFLDKSNIYSMASMMKNG